MQQVLSKYCITISVSNETSPIGGDVVFQCRDEGPLRAPVRWVREGGRPLKTGSTDRNGRLEMTQVTVSWYWGIRSHTDQRIPDVWVLY